MTYVSIWAGTLAFEEETPSGLGSTGSSSGLKVMLFRLLTRVGSYVGSLRVINLFLTLKHFVFASGIYCTIVI